MPCIVPGCTSGYPRNKEKVHFFTVPVNPGIRKLWKEAIKGHSVKTGRTVCEKHFRQDEILWQRHFLSPLGQVVGVGQYKIPRLRKGTVPSQFPWTKKIKLEIASPKEEPNEQSQFNEGDRTGALPFREQDARSSSNEEKAADIPTIMFGRESPMFIDVASTNLDEEKPFEEVFLKVESAARDPLTFEELLATKLCLPPGWFEYSSGCDGKKLITFFITHNVQAGETYDIRVIKNVIVTEEMTIDVKVSGFLYRTNEVTVPRLATSIEELQDLLLRIHRMSVCRGVPNLTTFGLEKKFSTLRKDASDTWRHTECLLLLTKKVCANCRKAKDAIRRFKRRQIQREKLIPEKKSLSQIEEKRKSSLCIRDTALRYEQHGLQQKN